MMRSTLAGSSVLAVVIGLMAGCAFNPRPIDFAAEPADWERLVGRWSGSYEIPAGRRGAISFTLAAGADHAFGDVLMIAKDAQDPYGRYRPGTGPQPDRPARAESQLLTIRFVRAAEGVITGSMEPYWDPDRECQALARFDGSLRGAIIEGRFTSTCEDGARQLRGSWRVTRAAR